MALLVRTLISERTAVLWKNLAELFQHIRYHTGRRPEQLSLDLGEYDDYPVAGYKLSSANNSAGIVVAVFVAENFSVPGSLVLDKLLIHR